MTWRVKTSGLEAHRQMIDKLPKEVREAILKVNEKVAAEAVVRAKNAVPVHPEAPHIRDTIRTEPGDPRNLGVNVSVGGSEPLDYAAPLEFGHRAKDGSHVPAQPFFFPVMRIMRKRWRSRLRYAIRKVLKGIR